MAFNIDDRLIDTARLAASDMQAHGREFPADYEDRLKADLRAITIEDCPHKWNGRHLTNGERFVYGKTALVYKAFGVAVDGA